MCSSLFTVKGRKQCKSAESGAIRSSLDFAVICFLKGSLSFLSCLNGEAVLSARWMQGLTLSRTKSRPVCIGAELLLAASPHSCPSCMVLLERSSSNSCEFVDFLSSGVCSPPARINRQAWVTMLEGVALLKAS